MPWRQFAERGNHRVVFVHFPGADRRHRAGGHPDLERPQAVQKRHHRRIRGGGAGFEVVLEVAGSPCPRRRRAERQKPFLHRLALGENRIRLGEHRAEEPTPPPVPREGAVGYAAVHHHDMRARALHLAKQVRPDFRFRNHHHGGPQRSQHPPHGEREVDRCVEDSLRQILQLSLCRRLARQRAGGDENAGIWQRGARATQEFHASEHLADRNRVQPDCARAGLSIRARKETETLGKRAEIPAPCDAASREIQ
jgi:hypothetical protein